MDPWEHGWETVPLGTFCRWGTVRDTTPGLKRRVTARARACVYVRARARVRACLGAGAVYSELAD